MTSFDIIGNVAIFEPKDKEDDKRIAEEIMKRHKNVIAVYKKVSGREGEFRLRKLKLVSGRNISVTTHKEYGCLFKLNVRRVYFSPREATERVRVAEKINEYKKFQNNLGEKVLVFFAGIGPYPIIISKKCTVKEIVGIEKNRVAIKYFKENIKLNKVKNVRAILGDVKEKSKEYRNFADFVIMPLPEDGWKYLEDAISCLRKGGVCFFYAIGEEKNLYDKWEDKIFSICKSAGKNFRILEKRKVLPFGVRTWKIRIDFQIED
ncbi:MAG: methyltransferase [Candidatus Aenigmatarchaeota archaeon]